TACEEVEVLSDLVRRARNYKADGIRGSDPFVDDRYLKPGFYSVTNEKGQYLMPDKESMPGFDVCGTQLPIYLKDTHPDITALTIDSTDVVACELSPFKLCENERHISIRKCGDDIQYYLQQTSQNSAYCFDPPELQNVIDIDKAPDVVLGEMSVSPKLDFYDFTSPFDGKTYNRPKINFECTEEPVKVRSSLELLYSTYWFIDNELMFSFERKNGSFLLTEDDLKKKDFKLGINVT
ncbi:uncharacterized protein LOC128554118, partial [Mercenaria mercenaria]|uniref:uncharacterized protein LOC128554118 n=1 Tax=Mercenaria mercenaria TaxID=6596 RepID=UPI00234E9AAA